MIMTVMLSKKTYSGVNFYHIHKVKLTKEIEDKDIALKIYGFQTH